MRRPPPTTPGPSSDEGSEPRVPSFAEVFAAANPEPRDSSRLLLAICGALAVVAVSVCVAALLDRVRLPSVMPEGGGDLAHSLLGNETWLRDVVSGQRQASTWDPYQPGSRALEVTDGAAPERVEHPPRPAPRSPRQLPGSPKEPAPTSGRPSDEEVDPAYAAMWGSGERYAALGRRASSERPIEADGPAPAGPETAGTLLQVRLWDKVAGTPTGAPVIALVTRRERIGEQVLPANSELHGTVTGTGSQETRIFLEFSFARLRDGTTVPFRGVARDSQGRHGIPAKKLFGKQSAGSVGLSTATRAIRRVGQRVAGRVGDVVGAGLEGATDSTTDKAQRVDRDEVVLIAEPGTPFTVYILAAG